MKIKTFACFINNEFHSLMSDESMLNALVQFQRQYATMEKQTFTVSCLDLAFSQRYWIESVESGTGAKLVSWNAMYKHELYAGFPTVSTLLNKLQPADIEVLEKY